MGTLTNATPAAAVETRSCEAAGDALLKTLRTANPGATVTGSGQTMVAGGNIVGCVANARVAQGGASTVFDAKIDLRNAAKPVATLGVTYQEGEGAARRTTSAFVGDVPVNVTPGTPATATAAAVPPQVALGTQLSNTFVREHANDRGSAKDLSPAQLATLGTWHSQVGTFATDAGLGLKAPAPASPPLTIGRRAPGSP